MPMSAANDPKIEFLRSCGALNPHPERVGDELFAGHYFFDPRDLGQVRYEMLRRVFVDERRVSDSARLYGYSRPTWYNVARAYRAGGLAGLLSERPGPRKARKLVPEIVLFMEQVRREHPGLGAAALARLVNEHFGVSVHRCSIERALRRAKN